jgi:hypothetical protein
MRTTSVQRSRERQALAFQKYNGVLTLRNTYCLLVAYLTTMLASKR